MTVAQREKWQQELIDAYRDPRALLNDLKLPASLLKGAAGASEAFRFLVPRSFVARMVVGDANDPLLRQVLPVADELHNVEGYVADPLAEANAREAPGLIHKYEGRVLLITAGSCAVNCRYCFRRLYPYESEPRQLEDWQPALNSIADDPGIHEVILSGGDPFMLSDTRLFALLEKLEDIPHVHTLRVHSRLPIVLPSRITTGLIERLSESRLQPIVVVHSNHPHEIANDCEDRLRRLVRSGIPTLNQTVLLKDVNDSAETLVALSRRLTSIGVMPYYLHSLDRVTGTAHFAVDREIGINIVKHMREQLPGYAVPRFVVEEPGKRNKTVIV